jgi:hypothetical protein
MSVIIKGVSLPEKCRFCPCCGDNGLVGMQRDYFCSAIDCAPEISNLDRRLEGCPLTELPTPHGRLVDADKLYDIIEKQYQFSSGKEHIIYRDILDLICSAETVIEAEVSE